MFEGFRGRDIAVGVMALIVATALTIFATHYVLHRFVLDDPNDPLTKQAAWRQIRRSIGDGERCPPWRVCNPCRLPELAPLPASALSSAEAVFFGLRLQRG